MGENSKDGIGDEDIKHPVEGVTNIAFFAKRPELQRFSSSVPPGVFPGELPPVDINERKRIARAEKIGFLSGIKKEIEGQLNPANDLVISMSLVTIAEWMTNVIVSVPVLNESKLEILIQNMQVYIQSIEKKLADTGQSVGSVREIIINLCLQYREQMDKEINYERSIKQN